jgi:hypothetical protein
MNVIILTPDRVGSTLLQRLITIYLLHKGTDRPVINLHELSNGLIKYYNTTLNQEVLGKPEGTEWGYYQSLDEITELLQSVDHYKTSRLAQYHIARRQDSVADQIKFYQYLNKNFYVISCRRDNLFEHAMSWAIYNHSKSLNVYSPQEKVHTFYQIYHDGIVVDQLTMEKYLDRYKEYLKWVDVYFDVQSYFDYDTHMKNIEQYILNLDFMRDSNTGSWQDMFGQDFATWNTCHRSIPNLLLRDANNVTDPCYLAIDTNRVTEKQWKELRGPDWPETWADYENAVVKPEIKTEIETMFNIQSVPVTKSEHEFFKTNLPAYKNTIKSIEQLQQSGFLVTGVPLKLQSLAEKKKIIKNFTQCVEWYNQWVEKNSIGKIYTNDELDQQSVDEEEFLNRPIAQQLSYTANKKLSSQ